MDRKQIDPGELDRYITGNYGEDQYNYPPFNRDIGPGDDYKKYDELASEIIEAGQRLKEVESLCGEIIATLNLDGNQHYFEEMPEMWRDLVTLWTERWKAIRNEK